MTCTRRIVPSGPTARASSCFSSLPIRSSSLSSSSVGSQAGRVRASRASSSNSSAMMSLARATHSLQMNKRGGPAMRAGTSSSSLPQKAQLPQLLDGIVEPALLDYPLLPLPSGSPCYGWRGPLGGCRLFALTRDRRPSSPRGSRLGAEVRPRPSSRVFSCSGRRLKHGEQRDGALVAVASVSGLFAARLHGAYGAAKAALVQRRPLVAAADILGRHLAVLEAGVLLQEGQLDLADGAVPLLGDVDLGDALLLGVVRVVVLVAVEEADHVRVLLDRAGFTKIRQARHGRRAVLDLAVQLRERHHVDAELLG